MSGTRPGLTPARILAASIAVGLLVPPAAAVLRPLLFPAVFGLMLVALLQIDLGATMRAAVRDRGRVAVTVGWQMVAVPVAAGLAHRGLSFAGQWSELVFLTACAGSIFGTPAFARIVGLDASFALTGVLAGSLAMPVILPLLVPLFLGQPAAFDAGAYALRLVVFIVLPFAIAIGARRFGWRPAESPLGSRLDVAAVLFLAVFAIGVMDGAGERFVARPGPAFALLALAFAVHAAFFALGALAFRPWGRVAARTVGLLTAYRNLGLLMAVGGAFLPADFIFFVALWQVPMYVMPMLLSPLLRGGAAR